MKVFMGGTYDPVHIGHLRMALELSELLSADVHLLPCFEPVHRGEPGATSVQRLEMLELATENESALVVDQREILRKGPSYTVDSLRSIREQYGPDESVVLVLGTDAFNGLSDWHQWHEITKLAHIIVLTRPGWVLSASGELEDLIKSCCFECPDNYNGARGFDNDSDKSFDRLFDLYFICVSIHNETVTIRKLFSYRGHFFCNDWFNNNTHCLAIFICLSN